MYLIIASVAGVEIAAFTVVDKIAGIARMRNQYAGINVKINAEVI